MVPTLRDAMSVRWHQVLATVPPAGRADIGCLNVLKDDT